MCVIVYKPRDAKMPDRETLLKCWNRNSDGAGFAVYKDGKPYFEKGFMVFDDFYDALINNKPYWENGQCVMHFRIGTQGGNTKFLTHPFPVTEGLDAMHRQSGFSDVLLFHNGILGATSSKYFKDKYPNQSDTSLFAHLILRHFVSRKKITEDADNFIEELIDGNKFVILDDWGVRTYGKFEKVGDVYYSNLHWQGYSYYGTSYKWNRVWDDDDYKPLAIGTTTTKTTTPATKTVPVVNTDDDWSRYGMYEKCDTCGSFDCMNCHFANNYKSYDDYDFIESMTGLSKSDRGDLSAMGYCCCCGEDTSKLEYVDSSGDYYCKECAEQYREDLLYEGITLSLLTDKDREYLKKIKEGK